MTCFRRCCPRQRRVQTRQFNDNNFIPSTVEVVSPEAQNVQPNQEILFLQTEYNTGVSFSPRVDDLGVDIVATGVYKIFFTGVVTTENDGVISVAITLNGEPIPASEVSQFVTANQPQIVTSSAVFKVLSPSADIGVMNIGNVNFSVTNAKLDIIRTGNF